MAEEKEGGYTGKDAANRYINGELPSCETDNYRSVKGPGSTSLQGKAPAIDKLFPNGAESIKSEEGESK